MSDKGDHHADPDSSPKPNPGSAPAADEVLLVTNADLRESANVECWPVQETVRGASCTTCCQPASAIALRRAHPVKADKGHGFISSQREGSDLFARIDPDAPVIVLLTAWQYSHHLAASLRPPSRPDPAAGQFRRHLARPGRHAVPGRHADQPGQAVLAPVVGEFRRRVLPPRPARLAQDRSDRRTTRAICTRSTADHPVLRTPAGAIGRRRRRLRAAPQGDHRPVRHVSAWA